MPWLHFTANTAVLHCHINCWTILKDGLKIPETKQIATELFSLYLLYYPLLTERPDPSPAGIYLAWYHLAYEFLFSLVVVADFQLCRSTSTHCSVTTPVHANGKFGGGRCNKRREGISQTGRAGSHTVEKRRVWLNLAGKESDAEQQSRRNGASFGEILLLPSQGKETEQTKETEWFG